MAGVAAGSSGGLVGAGGVEFEGAHEAVVDEHGGVGVVVVNAGGLAGVFDSDGDVVAADTGDAAIVDGDVGVVGRVRAGRCRG